MTCSLKSPFDNVNDVDLFFAYTLGMILDIIALVKIDQFERRM